MKLDKEFLVKQKFWVLLFVSVPLTVGAIFLLVTSVSGEIKAANKKLIAELSKYTKSVDFRTPKDVAEARLAAEIEESKKSKVWVKAYQEQEELFLWPKSVEKEFNFRSGLFAQKIKVYRGKAEPPATTPSDDRLVHGTVTKNGGQYIIVKDKGNKEYTFHRSRNVESILIPVEGDEKEKETSFGGITQGNKVSVYYHQGKYFNEPLTNAEISAYRGNDVYHSQIRPILEQVEPMNEKGEGVVQLKDWWYTPDDLPPARSWQQKFLMFLPLGWQSAQGDISEEAWMAKEDLWIQKELYRCIRLANDYVGKFEKVDEKDSGEDKSKPHVFRNPFWEISLTWDGGDKLKYVVKNIRNHRQKVDVKFRVRFSTDPKVPPEPLQPKGEPVLPGQSHPGTLSLNTDGTRKGIYGVEQVLTWETAAVKRIDMVSVASLAPDEYALGHRVFADGQKTLAKRPENPGAPPVPLEAPPPPPSSLRKSRFQQKGKLDFGANDLTTYGLIRNRYYELNPPTYRRLAVSLVLIVDQDHIDRVFTAFSNSKLRFVPTHFLLNRLTSSIRPQLPQPDDKLAGYNPRARWSLQLTQPTGEEIETSIELALYGLVTLYERYPPPLTP